MLTSNLKDQARALKMELDGRFNVKFKVTCKGGVNADQITIAWTDGPTRSMVETVAAKYECVDRDERTGEILSGDTVVLNYKRSLSEALEQEYEAMLALYPCFSTYNNAKKLDVKRQLIGGYVFTSI